MNVSITGDCEPEEILSTWVSMWKAANQSSCIKYGHTPPVCSHVFALKNGQTRVFTKHYDVTVKIKIIKEKKAKNMFCEVTATSTFDL